MSRLVLFITLSLGLTAAMAQETPLSGFASDLAQLEGTWCGTYESAESGRYGVLRFRLEAGADTARGVVLMMTPPPPEGGLAPAPQPIPVHFVEVEPGLLRGVMARYDDPTCGWELETHFTGWIKGDEVEGVFTSCGTQIDTVPQSGQWRAHRLTSPTADCPPFVVPSGR